MELKAILVPTDADSNKLYLLRINVSQESGCVNRVDEIDLGVYTSVNPLPGFALRRELASAVNAPLMSLIKSGI